MKPRSAIKVALKTTLRHAATGLGYATAPLRRDEAPRILCYHGVSPDPTDEWSVTPSQLRAHLDLVRESCVPVPLADIVRWQRSQTELPPSAVAITFDDGYRDVLVHAAPLLAAAGIPATAFVLPGLVDGEPPHPSYQPTRPMLTWPELRELETAGVTLGSHTLHHPILADLDEPTARRELLESRLRLEQRLGHPVKLLAYPYGTRRTVSPREHTLAREAGYDAAFLDMTGSLRRDQDPFALPRSKVLGCDSLTVVRASLTGRMDLWHLVESR